VAGVRCPEKPMPPVAKIAAFSIRCIASSTVISGFSFFLLSAADVGNGVTGEGGGVCARTSTAAANNSSV
jgi:hypothetical protein